MTSDADAEFPRYLMNVDGKLSYMTLQEAGGIHSSLWSQVSIGGSVLESDFSVRALEPEERARITAIGDEIERTK